MLKKFMLVVALGACGGAAGLIFGQSHAYACSAGDFCGYFKNGNDGAQCNILPDTSIQWGVSGGDPTYTDYCYLNHWWGTGHSRLYGVTDTASFINDMSAYLNESNGTAGYVNNSQLGGAFLIDDMLGRDQNKGTGTGINDARAQFGYWSSLINAFGANQCATNSGQMTCPGASYGINWKYKPAPFCQTHPWTSAYDPNAYDATTYWSGPAFCAHDYAASIPEIVIYWNNGANSFHIGSQCGNAQSSFNTLPSLDRLPTGGITVVCNHATWSQDATVNFSDPDGATDGFVTINGINVSGTILSGAVVHIPQSDTTPYPPSQVVTLHIRDSGPLAPPGTYVTVNGNTDVPCANASCGFIATPASEIDPHMGFSIEVVVSFTVNLTPAGTIGLQINPQPGATYSYNGSLPAPATSGGSVTATFAGLGPTLTTGNFYLHGTFNGGGLSITCDSRLPVVYMPYLNVYGGDVQIGASPAYSGGASSCSMNTAAGIFSWDNHGGGYYGAGTEYAVQTLGNIASPGSGQIQDFATAQGSSNVPPIGLSYANTGLAASELNAGQGLYGGYYGLPTGDCDFTKDLTTPPQTGAAATAAITALPPTLAAGSQTIIYATGDVYISRNIAYNTAGWATAADVPLFKLIVVNGDIYIGSNVTQLDGLYVAESNSGVNRGIIVTCATPPGTAVNPALVGYYNQCHNPLTINGAFVAKQVQFLRTRGTIGQATNAGTQLNNSAEVFNYSPELWLPRGLAPANSDYTAITGLPPIL